MTDWHDFKKGDKIKLTNTKILDHSDSSEYYIGRAGIHKGDIRLFDRYDATVGYYHIADMNGEPIGRIIAFKDEWVFVNQYQCRSRCPDCKGRCDLWESE